jgi:hypothetical protein
MVFHNEGGDFEALDNPSIITTDLDDALPILI